MSVVKNMKRMVSAIMLALMICVLSAAPVTQMILPGAPVVQAYANHYNAATGRTSGGSTTGGSSSGNKATNFLDNITYSGGSGNNKATLNVQVGDASDRDWNNMLTRYKNIIMAFTGVLTITCFGAMILQITKLAASGDNEQARRKAIMGILTTGIGVALLGSATIVIGFFYGAIANT